jgi:hypothetical protein
MSRSLLVCSGVAVLSVCSTARAVVTVAEVVNYQPGSATSFTNPAAALGLPVGDTTFGALTPFNPPFKPEHIVIVGAGGSATLRLSSPVPAGGAGPEVGVFSNNGLVDVSAEGSGRAGSPAATFSPPGAARVSVSSDGLTFVPLGGQPLVFDNPTNFYTDVTIENYSAPLGSAAADFSKPFTGTLASFAGLTYPQMLQLLGGSGGGTWLDVSSTGLSSVQYIRFDVPAGEGQRLVLDAVTAVPEPGLLCVPASTFLFLRRRRA